MGGELMAERIPILIKYLNLFFVQYNLIAHNTAYIFAWACSDCKEIKTSELKKLSYRTRKHTFAV
jgi:hypothetical protein